MPKPDKRRKDIDLEALVERALAEAGVAEAVEVYEKSEAVYAQMATDTVPPTYAASSTSGTTHAQG